MDELRLLGRGWHEALGELVSGARSRLVIAVPFITAEGGQLISKHLSDTFRSSGTLHVLTDLSPPHVVDGSLDAGAVQCMLRTVTRSTLWHVPCLHGKVYTA